MKKWISILVVIVAIILIAVVVNKPKDTSAIKIGFIGALSGDLASLGDEARNSTLLAVKEINEAGGIDGRQVEVIFEDGKCAGANAVSATKKLIEVDKVGIIFGGTCSSETLAAIPVTESSKIVLFTSWALNPKITSDNDFVFRNAPSDVGGAKAVADLAYKNGVRKISIITENTDYPVGFEAIFLKDFRSLGGEVVHTELFNSDSVDLRSLVSKTMVIQTDAVLINAQGPNVGIITKIIKELGNTRPIYGNIYFADTNVIKNYASYLEGAYTSEPANLDSNNPKVASYLSSYEKEFKSKPQYLFWAAASYDAVKMFADAVKEVGYNPTKIKDYFYAIDKYDGVLGKYGFDENGDVVGIAFDNKQIINGELVLIK
jgi:branched-chain amino acid transport system substrate-binding protein